MSLRQSGVLSAVLLLLSFNAVAVTIDFQSLEHNDASQSTHGPSYTEDGFTISGELASYGTLSTFYKGSTSVSFLLQGVDGILTANNGGAFSLSSIDLVEVNSGTPYATITFTGASVTLGTVTQSFQLDGNPGFQTFDFTVPGFDDVTSVSWQNNPLFHEFDNIVVSQVPLPAAVWLFTSGLLGLIGVSRRS